MTSTHQKTGNPATLRWEAAGLTWLREGSEEAVVRLLGVVDGVLTEELLESRRPAPVAAEQFAARLWQVHSAGAGDFGAGPPGWDDAQPGWIGRARLQLGNYRNWGESYAELRLLPHARAAHDLGALPTAGVALIESVCQRLRDGDFDDGRPPARIHGDLWVGNLVSTERGLVMIDPAAHWGHCETDLAMLALFGHPLLGRIQDAYAEAAGLDAHWPSRVGLHQLHPLLVHAELFGGGYGQQVMAVARDYA